MTNQQIEQFFTASEIGLIEQQALLCASRGIAPLYLPQELLPDNVELFSEIKKLGLTAEKLEKPFPHYAPGEYGAISLVGTRLKYLHTRSLIEPNYFFSLTNENAPKLLPIVIQTGDDWGLVPTNDLSNSNQWFLYEGYEVHIAQCISGHLNSSLPLSELLCSKTKSDKMLIRPDPFRLQPVGNSCELMERAQTYGRPFNKEWLEALKGTQIAQHDPDPDNYYIRGHTTQFIWEKLKSNEIQFSCEELPNFQNHENIEELNCTRFIHGIYNVELEAFTHFDGAIHIYDSGTYLKRLSLTLKDHLNDYLKAKIFRFDLPINFKQAELLISTFFRWNSLAPEYFTEPVSAQSSNKPD